MITELSLLSCSGSMCEGNVLYFKLQQVPIREVIQLLAIKLLSTLPLVVSPRTHRALSLGPFTEVPPDVVGLGVLHVQLIVHDLPLA
jgi:hypothetical protein